MSLIELGKKYGTDKVDHGYLPFYEATMPKQPRRLLEIGCLKGASVRMWKDFLPVTEIHVLDLFEEYPIPDIPDVTFHKGSQLDPYMLSKLRSFDFDVIIDDGSHNSRDQMMTFFGLSHAGCSYYIEDLHCCDEEFYRQGLPLNLTAKHLFTNVCYPHGWKKVEMGKNIILIC